MTNQNLHPEGVMLYCLGCGGPVCRARPGDILAISCRCGAYAPILFSDDHHVAPPASLIAAALTGKTNTHIEYYFGYSNHESPLKRGLAEELKRLGATSQAECPEPKCQKAYRRGQEEWAKLTEHQERERRIAQIGEP